MLSASSNIQNGFMGGIIVSIYDSSSYHIVDTVSMIFGDHQEIFFDGAGNGMTEWSDDDN